MRPKAADRLSPLGEAAEPLRGSSATRRPLAHAAALVGDAFCDHSGGVSAMRVMSVLVCVLVLGSWVVGMIAAGHHYPPSWQEVSLLSGVCGAKAAQSRFELGSGGVWGALPSPGIDATAPAQEPVPAPRDMDTGGL